jgi:hypothetical protein
MTRHTVGADHARDETYNHRYRVQKGGQIGAALLLRHSLFIVPTKKLCPGIAPETIDGYDRLVYSYNEGTKMVS